MVSVLSLLMLGATLGGVVGMVQTPTPTAQASTTTTAESYVVGPGDILEVTVIDQTDVSRSTTVQPDGRFTMPLLGDIAVAGKTVGEIQRFITEALSKDFLVNPQVEVRVREFASQFVLVLGEVMNPGRRALRGGTRLIDVLIESGGLRPSASGEFQVQRTNGTFANGEKTIRLRLGHSTVMTDKDEANAELPLKNGDVVTASPKYFVTVDGEVGKPGRVVLESDLTLLGVIAESGGFAKFASAKVRIIRMKGEGVDLTGFEPCKSGTTDMCRVIDIGDIRKGKVQDVPLAPNDKIVVSRRKL